ncbi:MAG: DUF2937 family protein [Pseudomonadota bacterium]
MLGRLIAVLMGLAGAAAGSQGPGYTLQYMQNLTGRIDELRPIVEQYDADFDRYGYTRAAALEECATADGLLDALCDGAERVIRRFEALSAHYAELNAANSYARPLALARSFKRDIAESVMEEFQPAMPVTLEGAAYAGGGFALLWGGLSFIFGLVGAMFGMGGRRYA